MARRGAHQGSAAHRRRRRQGAGSLRLRRKQSRPQLNLGSAAGHGYRRRTLSKKRWRSRPRSGSIPMCAGSAASTSRRATSIWSANSMRNCSGGCSCPSLLRLAGEAAPSRAAVEELSNTVDAALASAEAAGYRIDALLSPIAAAAPGNHPRGKREPRRQRSRRASERAEAVRSCASATAPRLGDIPSRPETTASSFVYARKPNRHNPM